MSTIQPSSWDRVAMRYLQMSRIFSNPDDKLPCEAAFKKAMSRYYTARSRQKAAANADYDNDPFLKAMKHPRHTPEMSLAIALGYKG